MSNHPNRSKSVRTAFGFAQASGSQAWTVQGQSGGFVVFAQSFGGYFRRDKAINELANHCANELGLKAR